MKEGRRSEISAVLNFFRVRKEDKISKTVPLAFEVALKGSKSAFMSYENLKRDHPYILIDFFQKKLKILPNDGNSKDTAPEYKQNVSSIQSTRINTGLSNHKRRDHHSAIPQQPSKIKQQYNFRQGKISRQTGREIRQFNSRQRDRQMRQFSRQLRERDSKDYNSRERDQFHHRQPPSRQFKTIKQQARPVRSCRYRNDLVKRKEDLEGRNESGANIARSFQEQDNNENNDQISEAFSEDEQFRRKSHKKILDYDYAIDNYQLYNLVSPAFIQASKSRLQPILPTYSLPMRINFKQVQREQYSSEQFKQSEESQFVLDDRGKQKRRKEKLLKEQQRLNRKRKVKKIKKKKKIVCRH